MITLAKKTEVQKQIVKYLIEHMTKDKTIIHSKDVERNIIKDGRGCLSVSKILRRMRQLGYIYYDDPRKNGHFYHIYIQPKLIEWYNDINKNNDKIWETKNTIKIWKVN